MDYEQLTRAELIRKLQGDEAARRALEARLDEAAERERLLRELQLHQHELEAQNETLRRAQRDLEESRSRYVELYDSAPVPYCTFDRNCVIREINLPGARMLGKDRASLIGRPLASQAKIADSTSFSKHVRDCLKAQGAIAGELVLSTPFGEREFQLLSTAVRDGQQQHAETCRTAFLDVTERRLAERLARSAHESERVVHARLEGIDRASAAANAALAKLSGADTREFLQVIVDQARAVVDAEYAALGIAGGADGAFEPWVFAGVSAEQAAAIGRTPRPVGLLGAVVDLGQPMRLRDLREHPGRSGWPERHPSMTSFLGVPIRYQGQSRGNLYLANKRGGGEFTEEDQTLVEALADRAGVAMEIARLRQIEAREHEAAKISADRLKSAIESIEDALALYDAEQRLVLCNTAYHRLVGGLVSGRLIGKLYGEILDAWLAEIAFANDDERARFGAERLADRRDEPGRFELRTHDGRSLRVMNRPTVEGGIVQTIWDLTDDVQRERELREAREAAEAANAAKSDFLSSMSHELRTPLNAILGFAQLLQRDRKVPLQERHRERVAHILTGGEHLLSLIDEILDLSRIEAGRVSIALEPVALAGLLAEVKTTLAAMAERAGVQLEVDPVPEHVTVMADRMRLKQILMNYGSNAIKYGRPGGNARFHVASSDAVVRVLVADDGIGIPLDKQDKIFEPFQRAGQEAGPIEGTGIGLAITKRLTELMHGSVGFRSVAGRGSEFWIELPAHGQAELSESTQQASAVSGAALTGSDGARHLVVCIEDNPSNVALVNDLLAEFDRIELVAAATAEIGIELVRTRRPSVVIMDINLPGMSGVEARRQLQQWPETRAIPVIALSAAATAQDATRVREAGFQRYLTKPIKVDELTLALEELLAKPPTA